ncbi:hypothetical protein B0293_07780 [Amycolatopsis azurea DSM 43854]|uniref:Uncharacterized protein n=1 Tax=Amycolatopsis azurea DSM 43854 TaxID=1238180 RepID=M2PYB8_9PSEU|nr:hypothetical protein C791_2982 [Amycolatopsis azurea DSM 43854]OOC07558.1 hypothetical protein B0293_07780 [Amycolatopsis azurea DSM 43854]
MRTRLYLFVAAVIVGFGLLLADVSATAASGLPLGCGTALSPRTAGSDTDRKPDRTTSGLEHADERVMPVTDAERCGDAVSARQVWSWLILGVGVLGVAVTVAQSSRREDPAESA